MDKDKQNITLQLDWHRVPMLVERAEEPIYREAALMLNQLYHAYQQRMPAKSPEEVWMYTALSVACELKRDTRDKNIEPILQELAQMNQSIEQYLNEMNDK